MFAVATGETQTGTAHPSAALLVIDMQHDFVSPDGVFARAGLTIEDPAAITRSVAGLVERFRAAGGLIVWVKMLWDDDAAVGLLAERSPFLAREGLRRGTRGAELADGLEPQPGDAVVEKTRFSAFYETELAALLAETGIDTVALCGVRTDFCVESTVRDAFFRDLRVLVAEDAVDGYFPALHAGSLRLMGTVFAELLPAAELVGRALAPHDPQPK